MIKQLHRFEGWYYKHQTKQHSIAFIAGRADDCAFVQVVTDTQAYIVHYPLEQYRRCGQMVAIGDNIFSPRGVKVDISTESLRLQGRLCYGKLTPISGDIMGPFRFFPMECSHGIVSMNHKVSGSVAINGQTLDFTGGRGYIESDSGKSFPRDYTWVQCNDWDGCSVMVAVARIPFAKMQFWGCIAVVSLRGKEYRLATYKGVKIIKCSREQIVLQQGKYRLEVNFDNQALGSLKEAGHSLAAPKDGKMSHTIRENLSCSARFRFTHKGKVLFDGQSNRASREWEMYSLP